MLLGLDRPKPYLEKQVASEILFKTINAGSRRYYQSSASVRFPKQYSIKMEDLGNGWRCQKLHNEIYLSWFVHNNFFLLSFISLCINTIQFGWKSKIIILNWCFVVDQKYSRHLNIKLMNYKSGKIK